MLQSIAHNGVCLDQRRVGVGIGFEIIRQQLAANRLDPFRKLFPERIVKPSIDCRFGYRSEALVTGQLKTTAHPSKFLLGSPVHRIHQHQRSQAGWRAPGKSLTDHTSHGESHEMQLLNIEVYQQLFQLRDKRHDVLDRSRLRAAMPQHVVAHHTV